ncbi:MAG: hypothetical protein IRY99_22695 [Isosphaeraceae bacterium]|nr:hypothetical protein [Isosphaeraceae bacterium]
MHGLIRLSFLLFLGASAVAIALSRMVPILDDHQAWPDHPTVMSSHLVTLDEPGTPLVLDRPTGRWRRIEGLPDEDRLTHVSLSPWRDGRGQAQLVGRWYAKTGDGHDMQIQGVGLARYLYPSGKVLDHVIINTPLPCSPPCWYPGYRARVLFAASDGRLYHHAFEPGTDGSEPDAQPRPLAWRAGPQGAGRPFLADPTWRPDLPGLDQVVIVSLSPLEAASGRLKYAESRLWWLRLDRSGTVIEAAGRLTRPDPREADGSEERLPALAAGPGGQPLLAYLVYLPGQRGLQLRLAALRLDLQSRTPYAEAAETIALANDCIPSAPLFTPDSRTLCCFQMPPDSPPRPLHILLEAAPRAPQPSRVRGTLPFGPVTPQQSRPPLPLCDDWRL